VILISLLMGNHDCHLLMHVSIFEYFPLILSFTYGFMEVIFSGYSDYIYIYVDGMAND
jgi:hypothetical protein